MNKLREKQRLQRVEMARLSRDGKTVTEIAAQFSISKQAVSQRLRKAAEEGELVQIKKRIPKSERVDGVYYPPDLITVKCTQCGKKFKAEPRSGKRVCSPECKKKRFEGLNANPKAKWSKVGTKTYTCAKCGKVFERTNYLDSICKSTGSKKQYCSMKCYRERGES